MHPVTDLKPLPFAQRAHRTQPAFPVRRPGRAVLAAAMFLALASSASARPFEWTPKPPIFAPPAPDTLVAIAAGAEHTCVLRHDGGVLCWGNNDSGQLGLANSPRCGTFYCATQPTRVTTDVNGQPFTASRLTAGHHHSCSLDKRGNAFCWGFNIDSQTGVASQLQVWQPTPVAQGHQFTDISAGTRATCAVEPNATWCWGAAGDITGTGVSTLHPLPIPNSGRHQAVATGFEHVCVQTDVYGFNEINCHGKNTWGQTTNDPVAFPTLPALFGSTFGRPVGPPSTRVQFTCADRRSDGTVVCAGDNTYGWLGDGTNKASFTPVVAGGASMKLSGVTAGWTHACAIDPDRRAFCWGDGYHGQLGNGSTLAKWSPEPVAGDIEFRALAAGQMHTCGISTDNQIHCWGANHRGQLGVGDYRGWAWKPMPVLPVRQD